jgi:hypothetical protein
MVNMDYRYGAGPRLLRPTLPAANHESTNAYFKKGYGDFVPASAVCR